MSLQPSEAILRSEGLRRALGIRMFVPAEPSREHLEVLKDAPWYMSHQRIAELSGVAESSIAQVVRGWRTGSRGREEYNEVHRDTEAAILGVKPEKATPVRGGGRVPPAGARRRLQALAALGFPMRCLSEGIGWGDDPQPVHRLVTGKSAQNFVMHSTYLKVCELYEKLSEADPADFGFSNVSTGRARAAAKRHGYAPPSCWDPDTIDDPDTFPEWTGECGTPLGLRIHYRDGIPACPPCLATRQAVGKVEVPRVDPDKLRSARLASGMSLEGLAHRLGVNKSSTYYWETGRSSPRSRRVLDQLLTELRVGEEDVCAGL